MYSCPNATAIEGIGLLRLLTLLKYPHRHFLPLHFPHISGPSGRHYTRSSAFVQQLVETERGLAHKRRSIARKQKRVAQCRNTIRGEQPTEGERKCCAGRPRARLACRASQRTRERLMQRVPIGQPQRARANEEGRCLVQATAEHANQGRAYTLGPNRRRVCPPSTST